MKIKIAICVTDKNIHSGNWSSQWEIYCIENKISYEIVNSYNSDVINKLKEFDIVLWHFSGYNFQDMLFARSILYAAKQMGKKIYPDFNDIWHFDDKVAETFLLQSINAPIPKSQVFFSQKHMIDWIEIEKPKFPIIAKLRNGSGSHNVKKINNLNEANEYAKIMFSAGFDTSPSLLYKTKSNVISAKSLKIFVKRLLRAREFLSTLKKSKEFPNEKQYVFFQEFIPNDGFDLKVVVVGDKLSFIGRKIRKGDFRASGGGDLFYERNFINKELIDSAFEISDKLGFECMGYDFVINKENNKGLIVEISYGFSHSALLNAGGYYTREGEWISEPMNVPFEILKRILNK
jgi:glutathione synthase/RimK-type ligase-like ATP-grasp enzyme